MKRKKTEKIYLSERTRKTISDSHVKHFICYIVHLPIFIKYIINLSVNLGYGFTKRILYFYGMYG